MSTLFVTMLSAHILLGLLGLVASFAVLLGLLKKTPAGRTLFTASLVSAASYVLSWISGGYYYVLYYGENVKPIIKEGMYPWAHLIIMEWKEHAFLVIPILSVTLAVGLWFFKEQPKNMNLKGALTYLAAIIVVLGTLITLSGIVISGGAR